MQGTARIYVASSIYDRALKNQYRLADYEDILQVGAVLTDKRVTTECFMDSEGDSISFKNRQFCELTGLYWIWKNASENYTGLVHYRRHFLLPDDWLYRMQVHNVDVILPVPLYVAPSIAENYMERHVKSDWLYLVEYFRECIPAEYEDAMRVFAGNLYFPCNMLIARKSVLDDLCSWLFPILLAVAENGGQKDDPYMNRYPGFISERLITFFFESRADQYKIAYANKNFLT